MITRPWNVLSLCDGISVGNIALQKAGIPYRRYIASEIDKHAIKVTQKNYPGTLQIGDLNSVNVDKIPFKIDLVLSGTPCTSFSIAGKLGEFSSDSGQLFFQFCKILHKVRKVNPDVKFLFENVASMRPHVKAIITTMLGVEPIKINSALVSPQQRNRLYWCNWEVEQPEDRNIVLQDILEYDVAPRYHLSEQVLKRINKDAVLKQLAILKLARDKAYAITTSTHRQTETDFIHKGRGTLEPVSPSVIQLNPAQEFGSVPRIQNRIYDSVGKSPTLTASKADKCNIVARINNSQDGKDFAITGKSQALVAGHNNVPKVALAGRMVGRRLDEKGHRVDYDTTIEAEQRIELNEDCTKTVCLSTVAKDNVIIQAGAALRGRYNDDGTISQQLELNASGKSNALTTVEKDNVVVITHNMMPRSSKSGKGGTGQVTRTDGKSYCLDTGNTNAVQIVQLGVVNDNGTLRSTVKANCIDAHYHKGMDNHAPLNMVIHKSGDIKSNQTKAACFTAGGHSGGNHSDMDVLEQAHEPTEDDLVIRRLTEREVCRLQGISDDYFYDKYGNLIISSTQVYKSVGNAWQSDTIAHILSYLHNE